MTPDQHRNQAELLSHSDSDEARRRAQLHLRLAEAIEARAAGAQAEGEAQDADWHESDHPRGQPGNAGQFGSGGGGSSKKKSKAAPAPEPRSPTGGGSYAGQYVTSGSSPQENHTLTVQRVLRNPVNRGIHYRRMLAHLVREAPDLGDVTTVLPLKEKLREALIATGAALMDAGRTAEAEKVAKTIAKLEENIEWGEGGRPEEKPEKAKPKPEAKPDLIALAKQYKQARNLDDLDRADEILSKMEDLGYKYGDPLPGTGPQLWISNVSPEAEAQIKSTLGKMPSAVQEALGKHGTKVTVGRLLTDVRPDLKGVRPRGWPPGTSWDMAEGLYAPARSEVIMSEFRLDASSKQEVRSDRIPGAVNHEIGHAFDHALGHPSKDGKFILAYNHDVAKLPPDRSHLGLGYYLQPGDAGRSEAFAEIFAHEMGAGSSADDPRKHFPATTKMIREIIKKGAVT